MTADLLIVEVIIDVLIPLVTAFLSVALKDSINPPQNMLVGGIYTVLEFITLLEELVAPAPRGCGTDVNRSNCRSGADYLVRLAVQKESMSLTNKSFVSVLSESS